MTVPEFLEKLRKTPRNWYLTYGRFIRLRPTGTGPNYCPIEAVGGGASAGRQGRRMGLSEGVIDRIMLGADHEAPTLWRKRLLEACGLS